MNKNDNLINNINFVKFEFIYVVWGIVIAVVLVTLLKDNNLMSTHTLKM
jgi:hypothetical protein